MNELRFEPLPPAPPFEHPLPQVRHHLEVAAALRARPGEWAVLRTTPSRMSATTAAHEIRAGFRVGFRPVGDFEAEARTVDGEHRIYIRYVGAAS